MNMYRAAQEQPKQAVHLRPHQSAGRGAQVLAVQAAACCAAHPQGKTPGRTRKSLEGPYSEAQLTRWQSRRGAARLRGAVDHPSDTRAEQSADLGLCSPEEDTLMRS
jgi:hypothetical protein